MNKLVLLLFSIVFSIISLTNLCLFNIKPVTAAPEFKFYCGQNNQGIPTNFAKTLDRDIVIIIWNKWLGNYSPEARCKIVSANFQKANEKGSIDLIHNGWYQGKRVICTFIFRFSHARCY
ncbi:COP23 domain-containing protein [Sphaerospermopsis sp. LEGE 08334]|jgi:hypothetical protein|uniref:COP23 domain-containing protein n=1 Tax=Sphaerospermopsis sp. LEGE 08334 TaxID=1828651 RepID=UPI001881B7B5|nr:COP23 domain-containing protein [Sphaerospermopsis sp. LEGE 08334]MBE9056140.1 hypothetical protein [Sphaerospermopsis sp. LEGE 08334]